MFSTEPQPGKGSKEQHGRWLADSWCAAGVLRVVVGASVEAAAAVALVGDDEGEVVTEVEGEGEVVTEVEGSPVMAPEVLRVVVLVALVAVVVLVAAAVDPQMPWGRRAIT